MAIETLVLLFIVACTIAAPSHQKEEAEERILEAIVQQAL